MSLVAMPSHNPPCATQLHRQREIPIGPSRSPNYPTYPPFASFHNYPNASLPPRLTMQGHPAQERRGICNTKRVDASGCYPDNRQSNQLNSIRGPPNTKSYVQRVAFWFSCLPSSLQNTDVSFTFQPPLPPDHASHHAYERTVPDSIQPASARRKYHKPNPRHPPFGRSDDEQKEAFHHYPTSYAAPGRRNAYIESRSEASPPKTFGQLAALGIGSMSYLAMSAQWNSELAKLTGYQPSKAHKPATPSQERSPVPGPKNKVWAPAVMEEDLLDGNTSNVLLFEDETGRIIEQERIVFRNPWSPGQRSAPVLEEIGPLDPEPSLS